MTKKSLISLLLLTLSIISYALLTREPKPANSTETNTDTQTDLTSEHIESSSINLPIATQLSLQEAFTIKTPFERDLAIRNAISVMNGTELQHAFHKLYIPNKITPENSEPQVESEFSAFSQTPVHSTNAQDQQTSLLEQYENNQEHLLAQKLIFQRWPITSPKSALSTIEVLLSGLETANAIDPFADQSYQDTHEAELILSFFTIWLQTAPDHAWATIEQLRTNEDKNIAIPASHLLANLTKQKPEWAKLRFEQRKEAKLPFKYDLFLPAFEYELDRGAAEALRFLADNADYLPSYVFKRNGGFHSRTITDKIRERDLNAAVHEWFSLDESRFTTEFGRGCLFDLMYRANDYAKAKQVFDHLIRNGDTNAPIDPFAAPNQTYISANRLVPDYFKALSAHNINLALSEAYSQHDTRVRSMALGETARILAETDPLQALNICIELPADDAGSYIGDIYTKLVEQDFDAAYTALSQVSPHTWPSEQRSACLSAVWTKDPLIAASLYQQMGNPPEQLDQIENGLLHLADSGNLDELQEVLNTLPPLSFGNYYSESRLAQRWFQADPDSMRDYALTLPLGLNRRKFLEAYATGSAELDIEQSWELGEQATDPFLKKQLFESSLIALTKEDPAQAIELANSLDSETGSETLSEVLNAWIRQSPQVALKYIQSMPTSSAKSKAIAEYVSNSRNDLTFAQSQAIIATLPQGKEQAYATGRVAAEWAQSNPEALADWVNQMPAGDARDGAVYALVEALSKYDYAQAFAWESTLEDDSSRQWRLRSTLRNFAEIDPQGAKDLLESSDIPSTEKATLRDELFNK